MAPVLVFHFSFSFLLKIVFLLCFVYQFFIVGISDRV